MKYKLNYKLTLISIIIISILVLRLFIPCLKPEKPW